MLRVENVSKTIQNHKILNNISFEIEPGKIVGLVGRNGAGKTTLLKTIVGILTPTQGDIRFEQESVYTKPAIKQQIVFVPDSPEALKSYSIREIVQLYKLTYPNFDQTYFYKLLKKFSLNHDRKIRNYSKGMKVLFSLVLAFSTKAKLIILDEPTDGLDVIIKKQILKYILEEVSEGHTSILISSHRLEELEQISDTIMVMKDGKIESHTDLLDMKKKYKKIQVVFNGNLPTSISSKDNVRQLNKTGRVFTLLLEGDIDKLSSLIQNEQPVYFEELPLTLEDLFVAKLGGEEFV
ncbi:ABC transporter ATP-binding protein [Chengkuizengella axinellae]|uniref:ABC transporter ATP-binding protein n=1 Tax=Chengkuizengella axinellae TaxID=3064388 RepID=A0ABT9IXM7_9BACL|nr:ABC transporter ATP-binding protein [Chengkuizengella sp. 2205SS18-9]MDP5274119.1 ABC transporter ATP-binding protein [Chengkuizengella sp. 2205SS18-9]